MRAGNYGYADPIAAREELPDGGAWAFVPVGDAVRSSDEMLVLHANDSGEPLYSRGGEIVWDSDKVLPTDKPITQWLPTLPAYVGKIIEVDHAPFRRRI